MDFALEDDLSRIRADSDVRGIQLGAAAQCVLDLLLDLIHLRPGMDADQVVYCHDPTQGVDGMFSYFPLVLPFDLAVERDNPLLGQYYT